MKEYWVPVMGPGSQRMVWAVTLAVLLLLFWPGTLGHEVEAPLTLQYKRVGTDVALHCDASSSGVYWKMNGERIHGSESVQLNGTQLMLFHVRQDQGGNYSCHLPHTVKTLTQIQLQLGHPPEKLHIQCWAMSYPEKLRCTWNILPGTHLTTSFTSTYRLGLVGPDPPGQCVQSALDPSSCIISDFQMFADSPYLLNVTATNPLGSLTQLLPFVVENIIRPDPPEDVTLSPIPGQSKKLLLRWSLPQSWPLPEYFPLKYLIQYKRAGTGSYRKIGPYEQTFFILSGVRPGSVLQAQVAAKDFTDSGEYSEWSAMVTGRPWVQP
ncbi:interleukin-27 subunit beta isoform X2 [Ascaphus truei]|uniref:interleukin-27 subunit beta isoform X2 n=1 Tax=Ascaphus truei TaxID=8439 RepID=UPI003F59AF02